MQGLSGKVNTTNELQTSNFEEQYCSNFRCITKRKIALKNVYLMISVINEYLITIIALLLSPELLTCNQLKLKVDEIFNEKELVLSSIV